MLLSPFFLMQRAVDIVQDSPHPSNKIAATIWGVAQSGEEYSLSETNFWPEPIMRRIGTAHKIGNSSGTIHAETVCILKAPVTRNGKIFVTDPPCPNCIKNIAEAGIKEIYIDHKGFDKDFAKRRGNEFESMALRICEHAGIKVFRIFRKEQRLESILDVPDDFNPPLEKPARHRALEVISPDTFKECIAQEQIHFAESPFASCVACDVEGNLHLISAETHPVIGYLSEELSEPEDKYTYLLEPVNRLLMTAARKGLKIDPEYIYSSRVPTSREFVNMTGAGFSKIIIADKTKARDGHGLQALQQLEDHKIIDVLSL